MVDGHPQTILLVDDDHNFRMRLGQGLAKRGYRAIEAFDQSSALAIIGDQRPDFAVIDLRMGGVSGLHVLTELLRIIPNLRALVLTGYGSIATALEAVRLGAVHYLTKPASVDAILAALMDAGATGGRSSGTSTVPSLERVEWEHIQRVLCDCDGNISQAAKLLGIHRRSLQRKLQKNPFTKAHEA